MFLSECLRAEETGGDGRGTKDRARSVAELLERVRLAVERLPGLVEDKLDALVAHEQKVQRPATCGTPVASLLPETAVAPRQACRALVSASGCADEPANASHTPDPLEYGTGLAPGNDAAPWLADALRGSAELAM